MRTALTIGGSDSSGGAGIQADLKTFMAHRVFGLSAITAITAQNTQGVREVLPLPIQTVAAQIDAVAEDFEIGATKIGMVATASIATAVAAAITRHALRHVVLDPVMVAKGGSRLLDEQAVATLRLGLIPLADVVTANLPEAEVLTGLHIVTLAGLREAAERIVRDGARAVVVKGGHLTGPAVDVFYNGHDFAELQAERIDTMHTHGTGCTFASATAAQLALGIPLLEAVRFAKAYVTRAIEAAPGLGHGHGPLEHMVEA